MNPVTFHSFANIDELSNSLSRLWFDLIQSEPAGSSFALAGGSTPAPVYRALNTLLHSTELAQPVQLVATDERWVADDNAQSNEGLFRRVLQGSEKNWRLVSLKNASSSPEVAAAAIDERLAAHFPGAFSAVLLGMGSDGHIASLFPGAPTEHQALRCLAALHPETQQSRISLSLPRLIDSQRLWLVITGAEKRRVLEQASGDTLPVSALLRAAGCTIDVFWCP
ncbi:MULTISPECIES: 6-phosphogluconolactonase [unclassified Undibacterium]|uniref:6-phosphogluconolactonase n=1 Tax=unclassified Undibacterium TaxID=2630295 RepID=UPI002AC89817|nr:MULTISPECIES: 6-phosphogluconolactonase [unclassified Undibacterium]MEB0139172.1 6-phosphogluconolactonase [Undibacterium sp. CCC2.1]MEB0172253.1 6-phosphogluconolactonase [Undibacterium sp. CCC1.1]MEB0175890.1 6-phosphogluconolactonase [Undibacterium sp. CCC3.4]MEB0215250.1 6-phosphogluconolactonase [Undibacterium sp. 5I2]WPX43548.1 6-phosphogluconolactonase [Undibacterium sp. CCC3.4]